jgi:LPS-assembly lipoprotein
MLGAGVVQGRLDHNDLVLPDDIGPRHERSVDRNSPLADARKTGVRRAGAQVDETGKTVAGLELLSERWGDTPHSVDQFGRAQEFSLRYAVIFALIDAEGNYVVPRQAVELSRDYVAPPADSVGATSERELLAKELRRDMSTAILRRVGAALNVTHPERRGNEVIEP